MVKAFAESGIHFGCNGRRMGYQRATDSLYSIPQTLNSVFFLSPKLVALSYYFREEMNSHLFQEYWHKVKYKHYHPGLKLVSSSALDRTRNSYIVNRQKIMNFLEEISR